MAELLFKIWVMIAVLPYVMFTEGTNMLAKFLKERNIYKHWDIWHSALALAVIIFIILLLTGYY